MMGDPAEDRVLRAKYLDWCSARIADRFLELTPDQIYELAHPSPGREGVRGSESGTALDRRAAAAETHAAGSENAPAAVSYPSPSSPGGVRGTESGGAEGDLGYRTLVERVTEVLAVKLRLPAFEEWVEAYRAAPDRYDEEILGFWRRGG